MDNSKQVKKQRAEVQMLLFCLWIVTILLVWVVYGLGIQGLEGFAATRSMFVWAAIAWTSGVIFPIKARHWAGWTIWAPLGVFVYWSTYLVLGL